MESIIIALLFIALLGFLVYVITTYIAMPLVFKQTIYVVAVVLVVLWLLGMLTGTVPPLRLPGR